MATDHQVKTTTKRSCRNCKKRHLKCELTVQSPDGSLSCVWCMEHGFECIQQGDDSTTRVASKPPNDGSIVVNGGHSAFGGFQLSKKSFCSTDTGMENLLRIRQDLAEKSSIPWQESDGLDEELRLDKVIVKHLQATFFEKIQPYIPVITHTYFSSVQPSQLLLAAMYGVAARLPGAIISSRDFTHIKRVLHNQLARLVNDYKPSLQSCIALCLIHLTVELQCEGIEGVEAWPLRLGMGVRMAMELRLNRKSTYVKDPHHLQEMKKRLFWALFTKDRWTSTGKGYPLMISLTDVDVGLPSTENLDGLALPPHTFFIEVIHQALTLGKLHAVSFRADRFINVRLESFREVEREVDELGHRLRRIADRCDPDTRASLELNYACLRLLFYGPFFRPSSDAEATLFARFIPNLTAMRIRLAHDAVYALEFASKDLLYSGPAIWGIAFYAQVRCFLVALSIKHDDVTDYSEDLHTAACLATDKVVAIAKQMCEEKRWGFMVMSGTLVLFTAKVAEQKAEEAKDQQRQMEETPELVHLGTATPSSIFTPSSAYQSDRPGPYLNASNDNMLRRKSITSKNGVHVSVHTGEQTGVMGLDNAMSLGNQNIGPPPQQTMMFNVPVHAVNPPFATGGIPNATISIGSDPNQAYIIPPGPGMGPNFGAYNDWDLGGGYENVYGTEFDWTQWDEFCMSAGVQL